MKISCGNNSVTDIVFYPYWSDDERIKNILPEKLYNTIIEQSKFYNKKGKVKRVNIDGKEVFAVHLGSKNKLNIETIRQYGSLVNTKVCQGFLSDCDIMAFPTEWGCDASDSVEAILEGFSLTNYTFDQFKKETDRFTVESVNVVAKELPADSENIIKRTNVLVDSVFTARDLVNGPANHMNVAYMENVCRDFANKHKKVTISVFDEKHMKKAGMNLVLGVGQGSIQESKFVELTYTYGKDVPTVCLIGKGVVFDTGGVNLKPTSALKDMKCDMAGSATVFGVLKSAVELDIPVNVTVLIPFVENAIGQDAIRPGDIITAYNKKTVEINNTDAEGRLTLADALSYADEKKPDIIMDFATLTGSAVVALGSKIVTAFFRNTTIRDHILRLGRENGEHIWEMPLFEGYRDNLKSDCADLSNIGNPPREAGSVTAALFLSHFTDNKNWIHFDIAGPAFYDKNDYYVKKGGTGVIIRTIVDFIEQFAEIKKELS